MSNIIARFGLPKQRATRPFEIIMIARDDGTYSTHIRYTEDGTMVSGRYDMPFDAALYDFQDRVKAEFRRGAHIFEEYSA